MFRDKIFSFLSLVREISSNNLDVVGKRLIVLYDDTSSRSLPDLEATTISETFHSRRKYSNLNNRIITTVACLFKYIEGWAFLAYKTTEQFYMSTHFVFAHKMGNNLPWWLLKLLNDQLFIYIQFTKMHLHLIFNYFLITSSTVWIYSTVLCYNNKLTK